MPFGRLTPPTGSSPMSDINMTPLIDVMLVLVVIFILTAPLMASSILLNLPTSEAARAHAPEAALSVAVNADGQIFLDGQALSLQDLSQHFAAAHASQPDREVQLRADRAVPYGRIVEVMGRAQQAGFSRIGFVADPLPTTAPAPPTADGKP